MFEPIFLFVDNSSRKQTKNRKKIKKRRNYQIWKQYTLQLSLRYRNQTLANEQFQFELNGLLYFASIVLDNYVSDFCYCNTIAVDSFEWWDILISNLLYFLNSDDLNSNSFLLSCSSPIGPRQLMPKLCWRIIRVCVCVSVCKRFRVHVRQIIDFHGY